MFVTSHSPIVRIVCAIVAVLLVACDKVSAFELESNKERLDSQTDILKRIDSRMQISDFSLHDNYFSLSFSSGETFRLSYEGTPVFYTGNNDKWNVSGSDTEQKILYQDSKAQIPEISTDPNGNWIIDGVVTSIPAHSILTPEDLEQSYISHIVYADEWLHVFLYEGEPLHVPVTTDSFYHVPSYFLDKLLKKEKKAEEIIAASGDNCASFVFFTDAHWGDNFKHSPAIIHHITDYSPISNVFFGGDVITDRFSNKVAPLQLGLEFQDSFSFLGPNFYCVYGNHDDNSAGQPSAVERHLTEDQVKSYLQSQMTRLDKEEGYNFYFDDSTTKTRYIGLDTGRYYTASYRTTSTETARFMIEALTSTPNDWHIVIFSHIWAEYKVKDGVEMSVFTSYFNSFLNIIHDYNNRKAGSYTYLKQSVDYDFTGSHARVECCIGGHTHLNSTLYSNDVLPVIIIGRDCMKRFNYQSIEGTDKEQCVAIFVIDYTSSKINLFHVGYGEDQVIDLPTYN